MIYYVYIIKSRKFNSRYIGFTTCLSRHINEHNSGKTKSTKKHNDWVIVYTEKCSSRIDARKREKYLKSSAGRRFFKKIADEGSLPD